MKQTTTIAIVALCVICAAIALSGCITNNEMTEPEIIIVYVTPTPEEETPMKCFGAIIITSARPGTEVILWKDCNNATSVYDSMMVGESGEAKVIAPVAGIYILTTNIRDQLVSVEEDDVIARNTIMVQ